MKLGYFLVFHVRESGNSIQMKTESIYCQDDEAAHTRSDVFFHFVLLFRSFLYSWKHRHSQIVFLRKIPLTILHSFINFPDVVAFNVLVPPPSLHPSKKFFIFTLNYTNTNEPLILSGFMWCRSDVVPFMLQFIILSLAARSRRMHEAISRAWMNLFVKPVTKSNKTLWKLLILSTSSTCGHCWTNLDDSKPCSKLKQKAAPTKSNFESFLKFISCHLVSVAVPSTVHSAVMSLCKTIARDNFAWMNEFLVSCWWSQQEENTIQPLQGWCVFMMIHSNISSAYFRSSWLWASFSCLEFSSFPSTVCKGF